MAKSFLRSGGLLDIYALGEQGRPVHASALQIRETLRLRQQQRIADCLAIPQPNEDGDRIDWYSPRAGKVSSWAGASDAERASALRELESCQAVAAELCRRAGMAEKAAQRLFGALLSKALRFPDKQNVYLVGGKPVLTFWGFVSLDKKTSADPFESLRPAVDQAPDKTMEVSFTALAQDVEPTARPIGVDEPAATASSPPSQTFPAGEKSRPADNQRRRRWRVWWLLPALAVLATLASQIRGGVSGVLLSPAPALSEVSAEKRILPASGHAPEPAFPSRTPLAPLTGGAAAVHPAGVSATTYPAGGTTLVNPGGADGRGAQATPNDAAHPASVPNGAPAAGDKPREDPTPVAVGPTVPALQAPPPPADKPVAAAAAPEPASISKNALTLSPEAIKIGSTDFLNGNWRATVDIKTPLTGKPPSLKYQLNHGKGTVKITHGDGVTCRTAVDAGLMKSGNLVINSRAKARCSDGTRYQIPEVACRQGAKGVAECKGRYDANTTFPITMKRESGQ
ncbi:SrfA family protein [Acerihabitans arboris]|uniref:Virulence factor n=1 Tax=Acerihabitans arboris TaxID=2691583 RepID=A0A845SE05_9GAMM|nr:SrfA family protein [Acerihabitans arboris]NDL63163.1 hypothetical protein [Acerihabitans arboris]